MTGSVWSSPLGVWLRSMVDDDAGALPSLARAVEAVRRELDKVPVLGVLFIRVERWGDAYRLFGWHGAEAAYEALTSTTVDMAGSGLRRLDLPADLGLRGEGFAIVLSASRSSDIPTHSQIDMVAERLAVIARERLVEKVPASLAERLSVEVGAGLIRRPEGEATLENTLVAGLVEAEEAARLKQQRRCEERGARLREALASGSLAAVYQPIVETVGGQVVGFDAQLEGPSHHGLDLGDVVFDVAGRTGQARDVHEAYHERALACAEGVLEGRDLLVLRVGLSELVESAVRVMAMLYGWQKCTLTPTNVVFLVDAGRLSQHFPTSLAAARSVAEMGFKLAVDVSADSLPPFDELQELNVDLVRVGGRLVRDLQRHQDEFELVLMLTRFAGRHGARVLAADCAQRTEAVALRKAGVNLVQGDHISPSSPRPLRPDTILP